MVFQPTLRATDDTLYVEYSINYAPNWLTTNQKSYANMVNAIQNYGVPAYEPVATALLGVVDPTDYRRAIDSLTGEAVTTAGNTSLAARAQFLQTALAAAGTLLDCNTTKTIERKDCDLEAHTWSNLNSGVFGNDAGYAPLGEYHEYNEASYNFGMTSLTFGGDRLFDNDVVVGWTYDTNHSSYSVPDRWSRGTLAQNNIGVYLAKGFENGLSIKGVLSGGSTLYDQQRFVVFPDEVSHEVNGRFRATSHGGAIELAWNSPLGIAPFVGYAADRQRRFAFREDDLTWGNTYVEEVTDSRELTLGFKLEGSRTMANGRILSASTRVFGTKEFAPERGLTASSTAAPGFSYSVSGQPKDAIKLHLDFALNAQLTDVTTLEAQISTMPGASDLGTTGSLSLKMRF